MESITVGKNYQKCKKKKNKKIKKIKKNQKVFMETPQNKILESLKKKE